jgi:tRNA nucleotidyltransferase (CCA-adding enzyme)
LCHDFGKPAAYDKYGKLHGHEQIGVDVIERFCQRLKIPKKLADIAKLTSDNHTLCHKINELSPKKIHAFLIGKMNVLKQEKRFLQFIDACVCDSQGRGPTMVNKPYLQADIAVSYLSSLKLLDAKQVVQRAIDNGKSGKAISDALRVAEIDNICQHQLVLKGHSNSGEDT